MIGLLQRVSGASVAVDGAVIATIRGRARASFSRAASPDVGRTLFEHLVERARSDHPEVASGRFSADIQVTLTNDGPVTFWLWVAPGAVSAVGVIFVYA